MTERMFILFILGFVLNGYSITRTYTNGKFCYCDSILITRDTSIVLPGKISVFDDKGNFIESFEGTFLGQALDSSKYTVVSEVDSNANIISETPYKDGKINGIKYIHDPEGESAFYELPYINGLLNGIAIEYIYDGDQIETPYVADRKNGIEIRYDGTRKKISETSFRNDTLDGFNVYYFSKGWVDLERLGCNTDVKNYFPVEEEGHQSDKIYEICDGILLFMPDSLRMLSIPYKNGVITGQVVENSGDNGSGIIIYSDYVNGKLNGQLKFIDVLGSVDFISHFTNGKKNGLEVFYFGDGEKILSEANYADGKIQGKKTTYWNDGSIKIETFFKSGIPVKTIWYDFDHVAYRVDSYTKGELKESKVFYDNSKLREVSPYKSGRINGTVKAYYRNGQLAGSAIYKDGKRNGKYIEYYPDGKLMSTATYQDGILKGQKVCTNGKRGKEIECESAWSWISKGYKF